ncbi:MAG: RHS repeat domain-containing protein, partial [Nitrososphaera sp.]
FHSSDAQPPNANPPVLEVTYSTDAATKTVYFLKDHLGSIRATVLDSATAPVRGYDDYDPWGYPLTLRTKKTPYDSLQKIAKNKFAGMVYDDEYGVNWFHTPFRPYDGLMGRWLVMDPLAQKYPSLSPYNYAANNPVLFIDANGDTIDYSALNKEQRKSFDQLIATLSNDKRFAEVWNTLATSTGIYKIAVNESQRLGGQYNRNTEATGSGGTLSFKSIEPSGIENITAHEIYHAYQHDQKNPPLSVGREIEASLFADAVTYDITGFAATMYPGRIPIFEQSYLNLLGGKSFNENDWMMAITTFKKGGLMIPEYKRLNTQPYNPLIKRFYPLIGR